MKACEAELANAQTDLLKLEKKNRRLDRKWNDNVYSAEDLIDLQETRVKVVEQKALITAIETRVRSLRRKEKHFQANVNNHWVKVLAVSDDVNEAVAAINAEASIETVINPLQWREDVSVSSNTQY